MNFRILTSILAIVFFQMLSSCGGGSKGSDPAPTVDGTSWKITSALQTPGATDITTSFIVQTISFQSGGAYTITKPGGSSETGTYTADLTNGTIVLSKAEHGGTWATVVLSSNLTATVTVSAGKTTPVTANVTYAKQ